MEIKFECINIFNLSTKLLTDKTKIINNTILNI